MAKYGGEGKDPYLDPDTGILHNRFDVKDQATLDKVESGFSFIHAQELKDSPIQGAFDLNHLKGIHKHLFSDVYEWAGELRQVDITKGDTRFAHAATLESAGRSIFNQLVRENHLRGLDAEAFSQRAGYYLGEMNVLHPFRDGNGRAQREFIGQLAREAGYHIVWSGVSREAMTHASVLAYKGDHTAMAALIRKNLVARTPEQSLDDSKRAIDTAAHHRGLIVRDADALKRNFRGEVVAIASQHALVQVSNMLAVCYERSQLDREVHIGEKLAIRYGEQKSQVYEPDKVSTHEQGRGFEQDRGR